MNTHANKAWLEEHYLARTLSIKQCAIIGNTTPMAIQYWLKKHGIPTRAVGSHMKGERNPFRGRPLASKTRAKIALSLTGHKRTRESVDKQRMAVSGAKNVNFGKPRRHGKSLWVTLPSGEVIAMRSRWEALFADWLTGNGRNWEYEPETFTLSDGSAYTPDFLCDGVYYEIKGFMTWEDRRKIDGFHAAFPERELRVIQLPEMRALGLNPLKGITLRHLVVSGKRTRACALCGNTFIASTQHSAYCSVKCNARKPKKAKCPLTCAVCGRTVLVYPSRAKSNQACSRACGIVLSGRHRSGDLHWSRRAALASPKS